MPIRTQDFARGRALMAPHLAALCVVGLAGCGGEADDPQSGLAAGDATPVADTPTGGEDDGAPRVSLDRTPRPSAPADVRPASLNDRLEAQLAEFERTNPPEVRELYEAGIQTLAENEQLMTSSVGRGDRAPNFSLASATGETVELNDLLARGPVVLVWYRGGWCPYCNIQLRAMQEALPEIKALGGTLVAVSPETPDNSLSTREKNELGFFVLSDPGSRAAAAWRLVHGLPEAVAAQFASKGLTPEWNASERWALPLPATYVVGGDGVIAFADVQADYRVRTEPSDILQTLRALEARR